MQFTLFYFFYYFSVITNETTTERFLLHGNLLGGLKSHVVNNNDSRFSSTLRSGKTVSVPSSTPIITSQCCHIATFNFFLPEHNRALTGLQAKKDLLDIFCKKEKSFFLSNLCLAKISNKWAFAKHKWKIRKNSYFSVVFIRGTWDSVFQQNNTKIMKGLFSLEGRCPEHILGLGLGLRLWLGLRLGLGSGLGLGLG